MYVHMYFLLHIFVVVLVSFGQSAYNADESTENLELDVQLSNPSSTDITVQVISSDINAISKFAISPHYTKHTIHVTITNVITQTHCFTPTHHTLIYNMMYKLHFCSHKSILYCT